MRSKACLRSPGKNAVRRRSHDRAVSADRRSHGSGRSAVGLCARSGDLRTTCDLPSPKVFGASGTLVLQFVALAALVFVCGCKSIRGVRAPTDQPLALTVTEAEKLRAEGLALYAEQPRTLVRVTRAARDLEQAARTLRDDYDAQAQAAEALAFLAENETNPDLRREAAKRGIVLARHGKELNPNRGECHYWYAINVGWLADVDRKYGLDAVGEMETELKRAIEIDERYDLGGPLRVLGILYLRTPAPPVSIGSSRKGLRLLQRAVELFPDYPENHLYLAEALRKNGLTDEAREALSKVLDAMSWPDRQFESTTWKSEAQQLRQGLSAP
jgi:tetratricopeptide (TPR) repeat protein